LRAASALSTFPVTAVVAYLLSIRRIKRFGTAAKPQDCV
jgi:hypothetical protein